MRKVGFGILFVISSMIFVEFFSFFFMMVEMKNTLISGGVFIEVVNSWFRLFDGLMLVFMEVGIFFGVLK